MCSHKVDYYIFVSLILITTEKKIRLGRCENNTKIIVIDTAVIMVRGRVYNIHIFKPPRMLVAVKEK